MTLAQTNVATRSMLEASARATDRSIPISRPPARTKLVPLPTEGTSARARSLSKPKVFPLARTVLA